MHYYYLDSVSWPCSQSLYHAAAHMGRESLFILRPDAPYICVGFHQDVQQEVNLDYAREHGIPVLRRQVGGGTVWLDPQQLIYQLVIRKDRNRIPRTRAQILEIFLGQIIQTYKSFGIAAEFQPFHSVLVKGREASEIGLAEIDGMIVIIGSIHLGFNFEIMSKALRTPALGNGLVPKDFFEKKLTSFQQEIGRVPDILHLASDLSGRLEAWLGSFNSYSAPDHELSDYAEFVFSKMHTHEWLFANDQRNAKHLPTEKRDGIDLIDKTVNLSGGLVRFQAVKRNGYFSQAHLSGDLFIYPQNGLQILELALEGVPVEQKALSKEIQNFYRDYSVETPGISPEALVAAMIP